MPDLHLYVHFPFCKARCPYCAFYFVVGRKDAREAYGAAVLAELELRAGSEEFAGRAARTAYFGGGTPSLLDPAFVARFVESARARVSLAPDAEISLEANPDGLDVPHLRALRDAGVNRLTLGWQSLRADSLRGLGRTHGPEDIPASLEAARAAGFTNVGVDLMFGLPGQTPESWREDLRTVAGLGPDHVSAYELTLEEGTRFTRRHERGTLVLPAEDDRAEMFEAVDGELAAADIRRYEISNFARPGHECAHNSSGWRGDDLVGLGASAASHVANRRWTNVADLDEYLRRILAGEETAEPAEVLDDETWAAEDLYLGLRTVGGTDAAARLARVPEPGVSRLRAALDRGRRAGLLEEDRGRIRLTPSGRLLADTVFDDLLSPGSGA